MTALIIVILGVLLVGAAFKVMESKMKPRALEYDVRRVRELENDIWGYYFTDAPEPEPTPGIPENSAAQNIEYLNSKVRSLAAQNKPRMRQVGTRMARVPDDVPDSAFAKLDFDPNMLTTYVYWKWTDHDTGKTMGMKSLLVDEWEETYDIYSDQYSKPIYRYGIGRA